MNDYPLISVIMTTHDGRAKMCERAIKSVMEQSYPNFDLWIIDDASQDETQDMVKEYQKQFPNINYVKFETNFGCDTRGKNVGILKSKGDYIALIDSDNEFKPDHLMALYQEMKRNPKVSVAYGDRMVVSDDEEMEPTLGIHSDFDQTLLFQRNYIDTMDVLIKREALLEVGGFDERYKKYVDWNLWIRLTKAGFEFMRVPKVISTYHLHKNMKSVTVKDEFPVGEKPFGDIEPQNMFKPQWDAFNLEIRLPYLGKKWEPKVAVFTLCKDRLFYTKKMFDSMRTKAGYPLTWFALDNGSKDGTVEWLQGLKPTGWVEDIKLLLNEENHGISIASNECLDAIGQDYDYIIKIDNDNEILSDLWLRQLLDIFACHDMMALSPYVEGLIDNPGGTPRIAYKTISKHLLGITPHIGGIFTMTHRKAYDGFRWDTDDPKHALQDAVFSQEMKRRGIICAYVEDLRCNHQESTMGQKQRFPDYFALRDQERREAYVKKQ